MEYKYRLNYQNIARKVKAARKLAKLTQAELAEYIDISENAVAKLENNIMAPSLQTLVNIANVLNLDLNYLLMDDTAFSSADISADVYLNGLIGSLSPKDKDFLIYVINGLRIYNPPED